MRNSFNIGFFILVLFLWNLMGVIGVLTIQLLVKLDIISYDLHYPRLQEALLYQLIFALSVILFFQFLKQKKIPETPIANNELSNKDHLRLRTLLLLILFNYSILLINNGLVLFSGDYYSRFGIDASAIQKVYIPYVLWGVFIISCTRINLNFKLVFKKYRVLIVLCILSSVLLASRAFAFLSVISLLIFWLEQRKTKINLKFIIYFLFLFLGIYFLGQFVNILRTYTTDFSFEQFIRTINEDSFNELRSFTTILNDPDLNKIQYTYINFVQEFVSNIFPSILYDVVGLDRELFWNKSWKVISPIVWGKNDELYGIRYGLVGQLYILMGTSSLIIFGYIYSKLLNSSNEYRVLILAYLIYSIPYGIFSLSLLTLTILSIKLVKLLKT